VTQNNCDDQDAFSYIDVIEATGSGVVQFLIAQFTCHEYIR
jgi:hypothetical protein